MSSHAATIESADRLGVWRRMDFFLIGCIALVNAIGMAFIASATRGMGDGGSMTGFLLRQAIFIGMGITLFYAIQRVHYLSILRYAPLAYIVGLVILVGVFGTRPINGARKWYDLYIFKFQPSEIMKPIIVLALANYLMYRDSYKTFLGLLIPLILALLPMGLILIQPDLGTFLAIAPVVFVMLFAAGARLRHLFVMILVGSGGMVAMWMTIMHDYQKKRVLAWLDPEQYRLGEAWQLLRSIAAIGSGGVWGRGWGQSSQNGLNLLPEKHTDFIYAVVCEEGGFIVAGLLLLLIYLAALSGFGIAARTREPAGRLIAVGCVTILCSQVLINSSVALGLMPTTGVTFPFVSYGGSSVLSAFVCLALLINVGSQQEPVLAREDFN